MSKASLQSFAAQEANSFVDGPFGSDLKVSDYTDSGVRILQLQNLGDGFFIDKNLKFTSERKALILDRCAVRPGDLIIAKMAEPLARACIIPDIVDRGLIVADLIKLRLKPEHDATYVCAAINDHEFRREAERLSTGTTRTRISLSTLKRITLKERTPEDEKRIGNIARTIDRAMEKTEALIEKYQQIKAGLMHDLFTRGLWTQEELDRGDHQGTPAESTAKPGQLRPTRQDALHLYQETPIGWIPRAWRHSTLDAVKESLVDGPFGSNLKTEHYVAEPGVRVVRLQNVQATEYNDSDRAFVSSKHAISLVRNKVVGGDILIAGLGEERYPVGRACSYPEDLPLAINKADCFRLRCKPEDAEQGFVMYFLNTWKAKEQVRRYEQGVTRPRINTGNLKRVRVPLPGPDEQTEIVAKLLGIQRTLDSEKETLSKLHEQKAGLMHDLLTGKVLVSPDA